MTRSTYTLIFACPREKTLRELFSFSPWFVVDPIMVEMKSCPASMYNSEESTTVADRGLHSPINMLAWMDEESSSSAGED